MVVWGDALEMEEAREERGVCVWERVPEDSDGVGLIVMVFARW
jgi:hypothetical protein